MSSNSEMVIFTRTLDLLHWLLPKSERFPKTYRSTVTQRLMAAALDFQESLLEAQGYQDKIRLRHLRTADVHLSKVRLYLHLIYKWGWLSPGQYEHVSRMVAEIGKLLGGWIRQTEGG
ncbi:MAG: diversity-generating retroelement protein Avd [Chloroflexi bacterium]|nr:diversity-generating retroelement protein Avd [Chloroflexota bacterium]